MEINNKACLYNIFTSYKEYGGAEKISLTLAHNLKQFFFKSGILSYTQKTQFNSNYNITDLNIDRLTIRSFFKIKNDDVVISHHRKITTIFVLLMFIFRRKFRLIHVAHNEFNNLKYFTLYPNEIIAVSHKVKKNLIDYFGVNESLITVIYNGIPDCENHANISNSIKTKILLPARISVVKQQLEIVNNLKGLLNENIEIHFAGIGEDFDELKRILQNDSQFKALGFVLIPEIINNYDYIMLFSKIEGLPTVLIEACMYSKPIICNNAGGNLEILEKGNNGFYANSYNELVVVLNALPQRESDEYKCLCKNSRVKYEKYFTIDKMINNYYNLIFHV